MKIIIALLAASAYAQTPQSTIGGGRVFTGPISTMTGLASAKPSACTVGEEYFATDAPAGANKYLCTTTGSPGVWTQTGATGPTGPTGAAGSSGGGITLTDWLAAVAVGTTLNVVAIGDSTTHGQGATANTDAYPYIIGPRMGTFLEYRGPGLQWSASQIAGMTFVGSWTGIVGWGVSNIAAGRLQQSASSATVQITCTRCDSVDVLYATGTDTTSGWGFQIDGGGSTTYGNTTSANYVYARQTISLVTLGAHTLKITGPASGSMYFLGMNPYVSTTSIAGSGVIVHNMGVSGSKASDWGTNYPVAQALGWALTLTPAPALFTIDLGTNDFSVISAATWSTQLTTMVSYIHTNFPQASILLIDPERGNFSPFSGTIADYQAATIAVAAAYGGNYISIGDRWGTYANANANGLMFDSLHPNTAGYAEIAEFLIQTICGTACSQRGTTLREARTRHIIGTAATTIAAGTGAGTSPTLALDATANDISGKITLTTGTSPGATEATFFTVTFSAPLSSAPHCIVTPGDYRTSALSGNSAPQLKTATVTNWTLNANVNALTASTAYSWYYVCLQ